MLQVYGMEKEPRLAGNTEEPRREPEKEMETQVET